MSSDDGDTESVGCVGSVRMVGPWGPEAVARSGFLHALTGSRAGTRVGVQSPGSACELGRAVLPLILWL